jgi:DnaJ-domain-containing protein 1
MADDRFESLRDRLLHHGRASIVPRPLGDGATAQALYERLRPFAEAVFLVMVADAQIDLRETEVLRGTLRLLTAGELGGSALDAMLQEFATHLERDGRDLRLDRVASEIYGDQDVELAVSLVSAAALANGCVEPAEDAVIVELAERLGISKARLKVLCG